MEVEVGDARAIGTGRGESGIEVLWVMEEHWAIISPTGEMRGFDRRLDQTPLSRNARPPQINQAVHHQGFDETGGSSNAPDRKQFDHSITVIHTKTRDSF
jgi:hypothetical protein